MYNEDPYKIEECLRKFDNIIRKIYKYKFIAVQINKDIDKLHLFIEDINDAKSQFRKQADDSPSYKREVLHRDINNKIKLFEETLLSFDDEYSKIKLLEVPREDKWRLFINSFSDPSCSGLGSCDHCNKKMYPQRTIYLRSWLNIYLNNKRSINDGLSVIPTLYWVAAETAKEYKLGEYHKSQCKLNESITNCKCDIAYLIRAMYYDVEDETVVCSLGDQIIPEYNKMKNKK